MYVNCKSDLMNSIVNLASARNGIVSTRSIFNKIFNSFLFFFHLALNFTDNHVTGLSAGFLLMLIEDKLLEYETGRIREKCWIFSLLQTIVFSNLHGMTAIACVRMRNAI